MYRDKARKILAPFISPAAVQSINERFQQSRANNKPENKPVSPEVNAETSNAKPSTPEAGSETSGAKPDMDWYNAFHQIAKGMCLDNRYRIACQCFIIYIT